MKRFLLMTAVLVLALAALLPLADQALPTKSDVMQETDAPVRAWVDIAVGQEGYYSFLGDIRLHLYEEKVTGVELSDLRLMSFHHSEAWAGGYYVYSYDDIQSVIDTLRSHPELHEETALLEQGFLVTEAST